MGNIFLMKADLMDSLVESIVLVSIEVAFYYIVYYRPILAQFDWVMYRVLFTFEHFFGCLLRIGAENDCYHMVRFLVKMVDYPKLLFDLALASATYEGHENVVKLMLGKSDVSINSTIKTVLGNALLPIRSEYGAWLDTIRDYHYSDTPLITAAGRGHDKVVELLLGKEGILVNRANEHGWTPLSLAASNGHDKVVKLLLEMEDIDVNCVANNSWTPLIFAAKNGHDKVVKLLLEKEDIDVNCTSKDGNTPLTFASYYGYDKIIEILLEKEGILVNKHDSNGLTPLYSAAQEGRDKVVEILLKEEGIQVNATCLVFFNTPLLIAVEMEHQKVVKMLLKKEGIAVNQANLDGVTPLSCAAHKRNGNIVNFLLATEEIRAIGWNGWRPNSNAG